MHKKRLLFVLLALATVILGNTQIGFAKDKEFTLAFTSPALTSPAYSYMLAGLKDELAQEAPDIKLIVNSPTSEADVGRQVSIVENFIEMKVDVIAICAMSNDAIAPVVVKANNAGIPVIAFNTPVPWPEGNVLTDVGYDQREAGRVAGRFIAEKLSNGGKIAIIEGLPSPFNTERIGGAEEILREYPDIKIIARQTGNWLKDASYNVTQNILTANPDIDLIYAISDEMALGAKAAVQSAGKDVFVLGLDGTIDAFESIKNGDLDATVDTHLAMEGRNIARAAIMLKDGRKDEIPPKMYTQPSIVTKENVDEPLNELKTLIEKYMS